MSDKPELGQMLFGNPTGSYGMPEYADALVRALLHEISRVYWNRNQKSWDDHADPAICGVEFRPYWWGDDEAPEATKPNLKFDHSEQEVRWYKRPGRGTSCTIEWGPLAWTEWFGAALKTIRAADVRVGE